MRARTGLVLLSMITAGLLLGACGGGTPPAAPPLPSSGGASSPTPGPSTTPTPPSASTPAASPTPTTITQLITFIQAGTPVELTTFGGNPVASFTTPSGNIDCGIFGEPSNGVLCYVLEAPGWPTAPVLACNDYGDWIDHKISVGGSGNLRGGCVSQQVFPPATQVLAYGSTISNLNGSVKCRSDLAFLACAHIPNGNGFIAAREFYKTFGTVIPPAGN